MMKGQKAGWFNNLDFTETALGFCDDPKTFVAVC
jgi:hypothetical protein